MTEHTLLCDDVPLAALAAELGASFTHDEGLLGAIVRGDDGHTAVEIVVFDDNIWEDEDEDERVRAFGKSIVLTGSQSPGVARRAFDVVSRTSRAMLFRDFTVLVAESPGPVRPDPRG